MGLISFCGILTLQVGAAILGAIFMCIAGVMFAANIFDYHNAIEDGWFPYSLVLMIMFAIGMIVAGTLMFVSSYTENRSMAIVALVLIIVLICFWLVLCCFSFLSYRDHVDGICIATRCPETFWIGNLRYRRFQIPPEQLEEDEAKKMEKLEKDRSRKPSSSAENPDSDAEKSGRIEDQSNNTSRRKRRMEHTAESTFKDGMFHINLDSEFLYGPENKSNGLNTSSDTFKDYRISWIEPTIKNISIDNGIFREIKEKDSVKQPRTNNDKTKISYNQTVTKLLLTSPELRKVQENNHGENGTNIDEFGFMILNRNRTNGLSFKTTNHFRFRREAEEMTPSPANLKNGNSTDEESRYYFGLPMMGAIILFVINLLFLLFSALVMYSWAQELAWAEYIYDDEPTVVVVEDY